jgi:hypothetical protein
MNKVKRNIKALRNRKLLVIHFSKGKPRQASLGFFNLGAPKRTFKYYDEITGSLFSTQLSLSMIRKFLKEGELK